jgi:hypothetical protein
MDRRQRPVSSATETGGGISPPPGITLCLLCDRTAKLLAEEKDAVTLPSFLPRPL